mmetsp:Transcript_2757/g.7113  ORF Transcript_2757/g.7113 Transcript_2757/m.7113 type:complete len:244 (-) Transcript_2757:1155-1886(-)
MYVGSMYLTVRGLPSSLKRFVIVSFSHGPTSASFLLPPASFSPELLIMVSPQPSATTMTACPFVAMRCSACFSTFSTSISISGRRQMSTWRAASAAFMAMKPQCLPMSFTRPMALALHLASTYAESTARSASVQAVSKPKGGSLSGMSPLIVDGTARHAHSWPSVSSAVKICSTPLKVPSPPSAKNWRTPRALRDAAASSGLGLPRWLRRMVPPWPWIPCTTSGVSSIQLSLSVMPCRPLRMP